MTGGMSGATLLRGGGRSGRAGAAAPQPHLNPDLDFFGPSTLDWCERNYAVLSFVAEFWNTVSNVAMVVLALVGLRACALLGLARHHRASFAGLLAIGVGSAAFHGTLLYGAQLLDELPMIWATSAFLYAAAPCAVRCARPRLLAALCAAYSVVVTFLYTATELKRSPVFHECAYGAGVFTLIVCVVHGIAVRAPPARRARLWSLLARGVCSYGLGFALWNVDNFFCGDLRALRARVGPVAAPALQLHAWWHLAQVGTYDAIVLVVLLDDCDRQQHARKDKGAEEGGGERQVTIWYAWHGLVPLLVRADDDLFVHNVKKKR